MIDKIYTTPEDFISFSEIIKKIKNTLLFCGQISNPYIIDKVNSTVTQSQFRHSIFILELKKKLM